MCGERVVAGATRCGYCGETLQRLPLAGIGAAPHRGGAILALGLVGLAFCLPCSLICMPVGLVSVPLGIVAWLMANSDLRSMASGQMDPTGEGLTRAGKIVGIITCCLGVLVINLFVLFFLVTILSSIK